MQVILTDCDGVLVNWLYSFNKWLEEMGHCVQDASTYNLSEKYCISEVDCDQYIKYFNQSAEIEHLPPLRDAIKYVWKMHNNHGVIFHCISALGSNKNSHALRIRNLQNLFGVSTFNKIDCVDSIWDKREILEKYRDTDAIWVEDHIYNAEIGLELGFTTYLMDHLYNQNEDMPKEITRVNNWKEIYERHFV